MGGAGLHKVVILVIRDNWNSNFSWKLFLEIPYNMANKWYFWQMKLWSQKQVTVKENFW